MSAKVFVGNLDFATTSNELEALFAQAGEVVGVSVPNDRLTGRPRGFAFVEMATDQAAQQAVTDLDGRDLDGRTLKVNPAQERSEGGRSGGGRARW